MAVEGFTIVWFWICSAIVATAGKIAAVSRFWTWAHKTSDANSDRLDDMDITVKDDHLRLDELELHQKSLEDEQRLQLEALLTIMNQLLDGSQKENMTEVRDKINRYLINK